MDDDEAVEAGVAEAVAAVPGLGIDHSITEFRRRVKLAQRKGWTCAWCGEPLLRPISALARRRSTT